MPTVGSGGISFGNIRTPLECEMTSGYGTAPSAGTITFAEQDTVQRVADLILDCDGNARRWRNVLIGNFSQARNGSQGPEVTAQILDRRWAWRWATISGRYNVPKPNGQVETSQQKTPQELAKLLFKALGEKNPDVSALPDTARPAVDWDYSSAANELATLCESLNCRVILDSTDRARIARIGQGRRLQDTPYTFAIGRSIDSAPPPDAIKIVGAPREYQVRLPLVAVGREVDGKWLPIDDLSYTPGTGWELEYPPGLGGVEDVERTAADGSIVRPLQLAQSTVYRSFRVTDDEIDITTDLKAKRKRLVILDTLVDTYTDEDGNERRKAAYVAGDWCSPSRPDGANSGPDKTVVSYSPTTGATETVRVSIDQESQVVTVPEPLYKISQSGNELEQPKLYLVTTVYVRDEETDAVKRYEKTENLGRGGERTSGVTQVIPREDCIEQTTSTYDKSGRLKKSTVKDKSELDKRTDYYVSVAKQAYRPAQQLQATQKGIDLIEVDGLVQQVTWRVSTATGAETEASQGYDSNRNYPSYDENRRRQRQFAADLEAAKKAKK